MDEVPSPAGRKRAAPAEKRNDLGALPWRTALYKALREQEQRTAALERERAQLLAERARYVQALRQCRERLENWKLRQQAWTRERAALLERLEKR